MPSFLILPLVNKCYRIWYGDMDKRNKATMRAEKIMKALDGNKCFDKETGIATVPLTGKSACLRFLQILKIWKAT